MTELMQFKASGCVFQTEQARDYFNKSFAEKSRIIMNPLDEKYMDNAEKHEDYLRNNNDTVVICNVGRIGKQKNQIMLIKAFEMVVERYTNCILKIVGADFGDGTKQLIEEYIASHNLEDKEGYKGLVYNKQQVREAVRISLRDASKDDKLKVYLDYISGGCHDTYRWRGCEIEGWEEPWVNYETANRIGQYLV